MAGIYIHIPFCKQACTYCNFHFSVSLKNKEQLINALKTEINITPQFVDDEIIETIYIGGGTPSLLTKQEIASIIEALQQKFTISKNVEFTLEANPDDVTNEQLHNWLALGVNRLSVGLQSFNADELKWMNRAHTATQSIICIDEIIAAGFTNFSVDLIYGSPLLSNTDLERNIEIIISKKIPHISCYALTVEKSTILHKQIQQKKVADVSYDKQAEQFVLLVDKLTKAGYEQYEISNFCLPNYASKHNSSYWQSKAYYGFGPSAHSFNGVNIRQWNVANNGLYIKALQNNNLPFEQEVLTETQLLNEYVMTSLRTSKGINLPALKEKFGEEHLDRIVATAQQYESVGKLSIQPTSIVLTTKGKFFADGIAADMFG